MTSLQRAGGVYGLVVLSPSVGTYAGGRFTSNVPIRIVQPATHPNNSLNLKTEDNCNPSIKEEGQSRRRQRQAAIHTSRNDDVSSRGGCMARNFARDHSVCWRELLFSDTTGGEWVKSNLLF